MFLTLAYNKISSINGFQNLKSLQLLDLTGNLITQEAFKQDEFLLNQLPFNLQYLILLENPICQNPEYRLIVTATAPFIVELDEKRVTNLERRVAARSTK